MTFSGADCRFGGDAEVKQMSSRIATAADVGPRQTIGNFKAA